MKYTVTQRQSLATLDVTRQLSNTKRACMQTFDSRIIPSDSLLFFNSSVTLKSARLNRIVLHCGTPPRVLRPPCEYFKGNHYIAPCAAICEIFYLT